MNCWTMKRQLCPQTRTLCRAIALSSWHMVTRIDGIWMTLRNHTCVIVPCETPQPVFLEKDCGSALRYKQTPVSSHPHQRGQVTSVVHTESLAVVTTSVVTGSLILFQLQRVQIILDAGHGGRAPALGVGPLTTFAAYPAAALVYKLAVLERTRQRT